MCSTTVKLTVNIKNPRRTDSAPRKNLGALQRDLLRKMGFFYPLTPSAPNFGSLTILAEQFTNAIINPKFNFLPVNALIGYCKLMPYTPNGPAFILAARALDAPSRAPRSLM